MIGCNGDFRHAADRGRIASWECVLDSFVDVVFTLFTIRMLLGMLGAHDDLRSRVIGDAMPRTFEAKRGVMGETTPCGWSGRATSPPDFCWNEDLQSKITDSLCTNARLTTAVTKWPVHAGCNNRQARDEQPYPGGEHSRGGARRFVYARDGVPFAG
jgi:hypothetical protein